MNIQAVAQKTKLSTHTLRYYEKIGLLMGINRDQKGHRMYSSRDLIWIEFIQRLKATDMPLSEIKKFAELRTLGDTTIPARVEMLERHAQRIDHQIVELKRQKEKVREKIQLCRKGIKNA